MEELSKRREQTEARIAELRQKLGETEGILAGKACVYATGSFGRGEAIGRSDLDAFIVGKTNKEEERLLKRLEEIRVKADLIRVTGELGIPEFDGDGQYLVHFTVDELTKTLGKPEDDATNTFTARLLLLLESRPVLEEKIYSEATNKIIEAYWRDYDDHKDEFMPAFLANDILRLWRTFCVNYEARTEQSEKAKRKSKNYTLKHSRMLTCFSALSYLLALYTRNETVRPEDVQEMIKLTPTQRLEWLLDQTDCGDAHETIKEVLDGYENFLERTNMPKSELEKIFEDKHTSCEYFDEASKFGDFVFDALKQLGGSERNPFYRLLVV